MRPDTCSRILVWDRRIIPLRLLRHLEHMILSTTVMVAVGTCSLVYLSSGQVFLPCLSLTSHQPFFSRITNTSQKGNLRFCLHHKWFIFGIIERARLSFALCIGFIMSRRKKSQLPTCAGSYHLVSRQILFCGIFSNCMGKKSFSHLQNCKLSCLHFLGSIC